MFQFLKNLFRSEDKRAKTIAEMEQQKHDMEVQLELLIELEKKIKKQQQEPSNN